MNLRVDDVSMLNFYDAMFIRSRLKWFDVVAEVERGRSALRAGGVAGPLAVLYLHLHVPLQQRHHKDWQPFRFLENYRLESKIDHCSKGICTCYDGVGSRDGILQPAIRRKHALPIHDCTRSKTWHCPS